MNTFYFTVALDQKNHEYAKRMMNSFRKTNPGKEIQLFSMDDFRNHGLDFQKGDQYRMTATFIASLMEKHDCVVRLDADQIITGDLASATEGDFDVAVVYNSNPRELKTIEVKVHDIPSLDYVNCGFVVVKSKRFAQHFKKLADSDFNQTYQFREQDLLNILVYYFDYKVKFLDKEDSFYGLASKGYWPSVELRGKDLVLPKGEDYPDRDKIIRVLHFAGGEQAQKFHDLKIRFKPEVVTYLEGLMQ